jgi:L-ectoine synthase
MRIVRLADLAGTSREVDAGNWLSRRLVLAEADVGFSFHDTLVHAGTRNEMWYRHHVESVYCVEGRGRLTNVATGEIHEITPGTLYLLDNHDKHVLEAITTMRMMCVFTPAVTGTETHQADGSYAPPSDDGDHPSEQERTTA